MAKYTMIESLPDISDLENDVYGRSDNVRPPLGKAPTYSFDDNSSLSSIRPAQQPPHPQSGMSTGMNYMNPYSAAPKSYQQTLYPSNYMVNEYYQGSRDSFSSGSPEPILEGFEDSLNCKDVANHVEKCKVCSRLYKTDITIYIISIAILIIICLLLLKRILEI